MLGILIRGIEDVTVHTSGGLGFSVRDSLRPDLAPARPGYVYVTDQDTSPKPPAPVFKDVTGGSGFVAVELTCSETVDGYYLEWSASSDFTAATRIFDRVGMFTVSCNSVIYLRAATIRGAAMSDWTVYGQAGPDQEEFTEEWIDEAVTAVDGTSYPNLQELYGTNICCVSNKIYPYGYESGNTMAMWSVASGVTLSEFGGKVEFRADLTANAATLGIGVVFGADSTVYSGWNSAGVTFLTLYLKYADVGSPKDFRAYLSSWSAGTETPIDDSGNVYSAIQADVTSVAVILERQGNTFKVWLNGTNVWSKTSVAIPSSPSRIYTGLLDLGSQAQGYFEIFDYLRVYSRNYSGSQESVDAGKYYEDLLGELVDGELIAWDADAEQIVGVTAGAALTTQLTTITHTAPGAPDYALQDLTDTGGFGFKTKDEGNSLLAVVANLQARLGELEDRLQAHGLIS